MLSRGEVLQVHARGRVVDVEAVDERALRRRAGPQPGPRAGAGAHAAHGSGVADPDAGLGASVRRPRVAPADVRDVGVLDPEGRRQRPASELVRVNVDAEVGEAADGDAPHHETFGLLSGDPRAGDAVPAHRHVDDAHVSPRSPDGDRRAVDRPPPIVDVEDDAAHQRAAATAVATQAEPRPQHRAAAPRRVDVVAVRVEEWPAALVRAGSEHDRPASAAGERGVQLAWGRDADRAARHAIGVGLRRADGGHGVWRSGRLHAIAASAEHHHERAGGDGPTCQAGPHGTA